MTYKNGDYIKCIKEYIDFVASSNKGYELKIIPNNYYKIVGKYQIGSKFLYYKILNDNLICVIPSNFFETLDEKRNRLINVFI